MRLLDFFDGTETVELGARERRVCTAILVRAAIPIVKSENMEGGGLALTLRQRDMRRFLHLVGARGLAIPAVTRREGIPLVLGFFRRRPGIPAGCVLAAGIWVLSTLFVWRVDVICLDNADAKSGGSNTASTVDYVDPGAVQTALVEMGVGPGLFLPSFDVRSAENRYLMSQSEVSWMAINRRGTVLSVEVRPSHAVKEDLSDRLAQDGEEGLLRGTHLVADADGIIRSTSVRGGQLMVMPEQMVTAGTLLASGMYTSETGDIVAMRAHGEVMAETVRTLIAEIPLTVTESVYSGKSSSAYILRAFGAEILRLQMPEIVTFLEIFQKNADSTGTSGTEYGIITNETIPVTTESVLRLPGGTPLPLTAAVETRHGVVSRTRTLTKEEALRAAKADLDAKEAALAAAQILSREEDVVWGKEMLTVTRYVFCVDNIAAEESFWVKAGS
ncbi:MAG: sporulation protein YqfD [Clostridia bacterium]|nr:sporulation protein YqfD [Clostridia bacterium]